MIRLRPLVLALALFAAGPVLAADDEVTLNFVNADLESTIKAVGMITGRNFVLDPRVKGTVNIVSTLPVKKSQVYPILLSALRQQGFATVEAGGVVKVVPEADAKQNYSVTTKPGSKVAGDRIVTQVYPLKYESASQLVPILRPLITPNNAIAAYPAGNTLVITDYADNIQRLNRVIESIDQAPSLDVFPVTLKYASAVDVAQTLARLLPEVNVQGVTPPVAVPEGVRRSAVVPDVRSNALLIRAETAVHAQQIRRLVETLDQPGAAGGNIHVIYLRNAEAVKLAGTLKGILTGQDSGNNASSGGLSANTSSSMSSSLSGTTTGSTGSASMNTGGGGTSGGTPQAAATSVQMGGTTVMIQADPMTNSLIITAPDNIYNNLRSVVDKLDVRRAQVYIEAMIAEVNVSKTGDFGIQWVLGAGGNIVGVGMSALAPASAANNLANIANSIIAGTPSVPSGFNIGVLNANPLKGETPSLGVLATALQRSGNANILSTPNLITLDNEEARIMVGQNIPIITGTQSSTGSNPNPFTTVEREDIGITLKVKPQVSEGGSITLSVYQEVSNIDNDIQTDGAGIATSKRSIESRVLVDDGQVLVLGGLIEDRLSNGQSRVPGLGDIPGFGQLFRYESREWRKTNLMIFLRPYILRDGKASEALSNSRYQYLKSQQESFDIPNHLLLPDLPKVRLPDTLPSPAPFPVDPDAPKPHVPGENVPEGAPAK
ncbi:type II secretion system secretin GspD [Chitiniphilus eburneus]|uniref:Type II secretion system protein GspD n=1 Tax=Chitiniphilus eburneus TaxID=2571148 RepID=A0A4U0PYY0_9NEIS|nr:type II secretion system secretin GspD [Chitiniphilus eburneus]TJZ73861.1 type II secretion system protein GspD [Chitiniphilus eburneus]